MVSRLCGHGAQRCCAPTLRLLSHSHKWLPMQCRRAIVEYVIRPGFIPAIASSRFFPLGICRDHSIACATRSTIAASVAQTCRHAFSCRVFHPAHTIAAVIRALPAPPIAPHASDSLRHILVPVGAPPLRAAVLPMLAAIFKLLANRFQPQTTR
jgi:hypothetical protein